jgi:hypothetical protein
MSGSKSELKHEPEEAPTKVIDAPHSYEQTHKLAECPLCNRPNPILDMHMQVREFDFFDASLYICANGHKYSTKHKILNDAEHLKIYDRTNVKGVW